MPHFNIFASRTDLESLPESDDYLFYNYKWQQADAFNDDRLCLCFEDHEYQQAAAVYHELWKLRLPKLARSWF